MAEKTFQTRIKLKYDTYANWNTVGATFVPLAGEVCFCEIPANATLMQQEPCLLYKVGNGVDTWNDLPWGSARAADVNSYALLSASAFETAIGNMIAAMGDNNNTYTLYNDSTNAPYVWQLRTSTDGGNSWADVTGASIDLSNLASVVATNSSDIATLQSALATLGADDVSVEDKDIGDSNIFVSTNPSTIFGGATTVQEALEAVYQVAQAGGQGAQVTISKTSGAAGDTYSQRYVFYQGGIALANGTIDIPKDMVVSSGTVEVKDTSGDWGSAGTYLHLILANASSDSIYIDVGDLIEYITAGNDTGTIHISIDSDHRITANVINGSIGLNQLNTEVNDLLTQVSSYTDGSAIVATLNSSSNIITLKTSITQSNGTIGNDPLDDGIALAAIAKTGNVNDLIQTSGDIMVFNCGTASINV